MGSPNIQTRIVINSSPFETRVALVRNGKLERVFQETDESRPLVGNIYKGKVTRVLPGMNAAFIDIGLEKAGFMHARDLVQTLDSDVEVEQGQGGKGQDKEPAINNLVQGGDTLLVQIVKPPKGTKGARLSGQISLPGRNMVFVPGEPMLAVSRKIRLGSERKRLRSLVKPHKRDDGGFIVRTAAEGKPDDEILGDIAYLSRLWVSLSKKQNQQSAPAEIFRDLGATLRTIRDMLTPEIDEVWIDDPLEFERVQKYVSQVIPGRIDDIKLFTDPEPVFQGFGIENQLQAALKRRVDLHSKGYLIIDETEALTTFDVNTGGFVGSSNLEDTVLKTNMEAASEIAHQLRLRNIAGIVVLDFIDMLDAANREQVYNTFREALKSDSARTNITKISELGLIEMTRQRIGPSLSAALTQDCPCCNGTGHVLKPQTVLGQLYRQVLIKCTGHPNQKIEIVLHPSMAERIWDTEMAWLQELEVRFGTRLRLRFDPKFDPDRFSVQTLGTAGR